MYFYSFYFAFFSFSWASYAWHIGTCEVSKTLIFSKIVDVSICILMLVTILYTLGDCIFCYNLRAFSESLINFNEDKESTKCQKEIIMSVKKAIEKIGPKAKVVSGAASAIDTPTDAGQLTGKVGLVTGGSNKVGLQVGIKLADKFRKSNSRIYLTTRYADTIPGLEKALAKECNYDEEIMSRIKFAQLDLLDRGSLFKLYRQIKDEAMSLDILVNNARKFELPSQGSEERFKHQCERALAVNYEGMKRICKTFTPMLNHAGRIVLCSSYLGHLSNIDGNEPAASKLRKRFAAKDLTEEKLDRLIKEFEDNVYGGGSGRWIQNGWPSCPFTVSKIAVNAYSR